MAAFAMRFLSSATTAAPSNPPTAPSTPAVVTPPSPTSPTSSTGPSAPRPPKGKGKPPPGPSPLSVSTIAEPTRFSQVLPGVNCKECGQSIPLDKLEEHVCAPRPPLPTAAPPKEDGRGRPMSRSPSNPSIPPTQSAQAPARRPSDPPRRSSPSPASRPPAQQQQQQPPSPSARSPQDDARLRPAMENDADRGLRRPSVENSRSKPETQASPSTALGNSPVLAPRSPARSPAPAQTSLAIANDPPTHSRPPPDSPNNAQGPRDPPSPNQHSPIHVHPPQHATSSSLAQQQQQIQSPIERITSPGFEPRASRRSNSETPYYVDNGLHHQVDQDVNDAHMSMLAPDPGRNAAQVLSTYGMPIPDTQVGGEAGMAGVGRRGFAAVAQAALVVQRTGMSSAMSHHSFGGPRSPSPGVFPVDPRAVSPGLVPGFGPNGPFPPYGPNSGPPSRMGSPNLGPMAFGGPPRVGSPGQQFLGPIPGNSPGVRNLFRKSSNHSQSSASSESSSLSVRLPFFERLKAAKKSGSQSSSGSSGTALFKSSSMRSTSSTKSDVRPLGIEKALAPVQERRESSSTLSDDDVQLAYDTFDGEDEPTPPTPAKPAAIPQTAPLVIRRPSQDAEGKRLPHLASGAESGNIINNSIPFPSPPGSAEKLKQGSPIVSHGGVRADSLETSSSSTSSSSAVSTSLLHNKNGKLAVGVKIVAAGDGDGATVREAAVGSRGLLGGDLLTGGDGSGMLESPTSSSPSPTSTSFSTTSDVVTAVQKMKRKKKVRQCRKCSKVITDGKWVAVDVGTPEAAVLCEYDWKEDYLPKCRRCTEPIEGAVISASDGQIVGKYHRDCFTCIACSKPFPDKSFYVFDGLPHCRYHYHEANGSLCASPECGQPVEGGCAIADDGKRYHPEHFVCEWQGGGEELPPTRRQKCNQELEDYWEFGPRKYCSERHAAWAQEKAAADKARALREGREVTDTTDPNSRATKRHTLFVKQIAEKLEL
ncbi:hypothetical protein FRC00_012412 [Tulasnella sp. 408]|nr:hypothetical protein FRC00_012412 [Tulasnella sp. 408]